MAGAGKRSNPAAFSPEKTAARSWPSISPGCVLRCKPMGQPLSERVMAPVKAAAASPGEVHDIALKAAETDATKRALATFGKPFGLELYRQNRTPGDSIAIKACGRCYRDPLRLSPRRYNTHSAAVALLWSASKSTPPQAVVHAASITSAAAHSECDHPRQDRQKRPCLGRTQTPPR